MNDPLTVLVTTALFVLVFVLGFVLKRRGRPHHVLLLTAHKLLAVAALILMAITVIRINRATPLATAALVAAAATGVFFVVAIISGGLVSTDKPAPALARALQGACTPGSVDCGGSRCGALHRLRVCDVRDAHLRAGDEDASDESGCHKVASSGCDCHKPTGTQRHPCRHADRGAAADAQLASRIDSFLAGLAAQDRFSGSVLVAKDGQVVLSKGHNLADREHALPNTPQTVFRIGSLTKQFTAMAVLQLQQAGKLHGKLGVNRQAQAVARAREVGLL